MWKFRNLLEELKFLNSWNIRILILFSYFFIPLFLSLFFAFTLSGFKTLFYIKSKTFMKLFLFQTPVNAHALLLQRNFWNRVWKKKKITINYYWFSIMNAQDLVSPSSRTFLFPYLFRKHFSNAPPHHVIRKNYWKFHPREEIALIGVSKASRKAI